LRIATFPHVHLKKHAILTLGALHAIFAFHGITCILGPLSVGWFRPLPYMAFMLILNLGTAYTLLVSQKRLLLLSCAIGNIYVALSAVRDWTGYHYTKITIHDLGTLNLGNWSFIITSYGFEILVYGLSAFFMFKMKDAKSTDIDLQKPAS